MKASNIMAFSISRRQSGVALVVSLILLLVMTLIGLAASRSTMLQERMSANTYDRSLAFQRTEAALRAAEAAITANWQIATLSGLDCTPTSGNLCDVVPANAFTGTNANWVNVGSAYDVNDSLTTGVPQYQIQWLGTGQADNSYGTGENANSTNYGSNSAPDSVAYYRVTARSSDPTALAGRAIVVLQTTVRRPF